MCLCYRHPQRMLGRVVLWRPVTHTHTSHFSKVGADLVDAETIWLVEETSPQKTESKT